MPTVTEKVDERILRLLGLEFVFDLDYGTYLSLLNGAIVTGKNRLPPEELALLSNEKKRIRSKQGRFKPKKQKITADKIATTKFLKPSVRPISTPPIAPSQVQAPQVQSVDLSPLQEPLDSIKNTLSQFLKFRKGSDEQERRGYEAQRRSKGEALLENTQKGMSAVSNAVQTFISPFQGIMDRIWRFIFFTLLGRTFTQLIDWFKDPKNTKKVETLQRFFKDWWPTLLGAAVLFFTPFGRFVRVVLRIVGGLTGRLVAQIPKIGGAINALRLVVARNPLLAGLAIGTAAVAGAATYFNQQQKKESESQEEDDAQQQVQQFSSGGSILNSLFGVNQVSPHTQLFGYGGITNDTGQRISGFGPDTQLIAAQPGEIVINKRTVDAVGGDTFLTMNRYYGGPGANQPKMGRRFNTGGPIDAGGSVGRRINTGGSVGSVGSDTFLTTNRYYGGPGANQPKMGRRFNTGGPIDAGGSVGRRINTGGSVGSVGSDTFLTTNRYYGGPGANQPKMGRRFNTGGTVSLFGYGGITNDTGQRISGFGPDTQLIAAQPGEIVINKRTVDAVGSDTFLTMNRYYGGPGANQPKMGRMFNTGGPIDAGGSVGRRFNTGGTVSLFGYGGITNDTGQRISGFGPDTQLIAAQPGEIVINKRTVDAVGSDTFLTMNRYYGGPGANQPKMGRMFNTGGQVPKYGESLKYRSPIPGYPNYQQPKDKYGAFYAKIYRLAKAYGDPFPEVTAAQAAEESGYGSSHLAKKANNLFGQDAPKGVSGYKYMDPIGGKEHNAMMFKSIEESVAYRVRKWKKYYGNAKTPEQAIMNIAKSGYNPHAPYPGKITALMREQGVDPALPSPLRPAVAKPKPKKEKEKESDPQRPWYDPFGFFGGAAAVQKKKDGGIFNITKDTGFDIPSSAFSGAGIDSQFVPLALQPGEQGGILTKKAVENGAVPAFENLLAQFDPTSNPAKSLNYRSDPKIPEIKPLNKENGGVTYLPDIVQSASGGTGGSAGGGPQVPLFSAISPKSSRATQTLICGIKGV
jgi:hypothetical protein